MKVAYEKINEFKLFGIKFFEHNQKYFEYSTDKDNSYDSIFCETIKKYIENNN